jgi:hypothetical protein
MKATPLLIGSHNDNTPINSVHFDPHDKGRLATAGRYVLDSSRSTLLAKYDMLTRSVTVTIMFGYGSFHYLHLYLF